MHRVLITGSTDGIGKATALALARDKGVNVIIHGRNADKVNRVVAELKEACRAATGDSESQEHQRTEVEIDGIVADLSLVQNVRAMGAEVLARFPDITGLINNAATWPSKREVTSEGIERSFAVNHLASVALTASLLSILSRNGSRLDRNSRVLFVSSVAHAKYPNGVAYESNARFDWDNLQSENVHEPYQVYALAKLLNIMTAGEFARRHPCNDTRVTFNSLHPGVIDTPLLREGLPDLVEKAKPLEDGALTPVYLATHPDVEGMSGIYFEDNAEARRHPLAENSETVAQVWAKTHDILARAVDDGTPESPGDKATPQSPGEAERTKDG